MEKGLTSEHALELAALYRLIDAIIIGASLWALASYNELDNLLYSNLALIAVVLFAIVGEICGIYRSWRGSGYLRIFLYTNLAWILTLVILLVVGFVFKQTAQFSRLLLGTWMVLAGGLLVTWRYGVFSLLRWLRRRGYNVRRVAIIGATELGRELGQSINTNPTLGMKLVAYFDDRHKQRERLAIDLPAPLSGDFEEILQLAKSGKLDLVYITLPFKAQDRTVYYLNMLADTTVSVHIVPDFFVFGLLHARMGKVGSVTTLSVYESPFYGANGALKRLEDVVLASLILIVISLPMLVIATLIKITSKGPVLFKQDRYGLDGARISVWKFRSMTVTENGDTVIQAKRGDTRITPLGAFLRKTSLDELPQFFNVLTGDMSVVGPRPHAVAHNEEYRKRIQGYMLRHKIKPGITGWAQINGFRGETDTLQKMEQRVKFDLDYIRNWSIFLDLKIVLLTIFKGFVNKNAY